MVVVKSSLAILARKMYHSDQQSDLNVVLEAKQVWIVMIS